MKHEKNKLALETGQKGLELTFKYVFINSCVSEEVLKKCPIDR